MYKAVSVRGFYSLPLRQQHLLVVSFAISILRGALATPPLSFLHPALAMNPLTPSVALSFHTPASII